MRGYLQAWSVRLLPAVASAPSHALRRVPRPKRSRQSAEHLEVLERMSHERRRALRVTEHVQGRRLY